MTRPLHVTVRLLPGGDAPVELWIEGDRFVEGPLANAIELAPAGLFATTGLVDSHAHLSFPHDREDPAHTPASMNEARARYAATGVTLVRDMGSATEHILALDTERDGLTRVRAAGLLLLKHDDFPFTVTTDDALSERALHQIERGASWVKVFTDWSPDFGGRHRVGFGRDDELTYPVDVLRAMVEAVHARGARVAAHCFTMPGAEAAIVAGVDCLEHGWGVDEAMVERMAARGMGWCPMLAMARPMREAAVRDGEASRVAWIDASLAQLARCLPLAASRGVTLLAGADWFPEITVADEVLELIATGVTVETAVAAGTWRARDYLGLPSATPGAPADLVLFPQDPRTHPETLFDPQLILIGARNIEPSFASLRPGPRPLTPGPRANDR